MLALLSGRRWPSLVLERRTRRVGEKAAPRCVHMTIAETALLIIEALWQHDRKMVSRTRHRDIKQPTLLFDFFFIATRHVGRDATIDAVQYVNDFPFLALRRMNRRENQIVFIQQRLIRPA